MINFSGSPNDATVFDFIEELVTLVLHTTPGDQVRYKHICDAFREIKIYCQSPEQIETLNEAFQQVVRDKEWIFKIEELKRIKKERGIVFSKFFKKPTLPKKVDMSKMTKPRRRTARTFNGKPCRKCGSVVRYVSTKVCVECTNKRSREQYRKRKQK